MSKTIDQMVDARLQLRGSHSAQFAEVPQMLACCKARVIAQAVGQSADTALRGNGLFRWIHAIHENPPAVGASEARHHTKSRGLPRPVRTHQPRDTPVRSGETDAIHRGNPSKELANIFNLNHGYRNSLGRKKELTMCYSISHWEMRTGVNIEALSVLATSDL
jgi:hypothetical protein